MVLPYPYERKHVGAKKRMATPSRHIYVQVCDEHSRCDLRACRHVTKMKLNNIAVLGFALVGMPKNGFCSLKCSHVTNRFYRSLKTIHLGPLAQARATALNDSTGLEPRNDPEVATAFNALRDRVSV